MEETEYLREGNLLVTSTRIELDGQTFAVRNIGSVKVTKPGTPWIAALVLIMGVPMIFQPTIIVAGLVISGAAAAWIYQAVRMRRLVLISGGGEEVALKSTNGAMVERVRAAIANAIATR